MSNHLHGLLGKEFLGLLVMLTTVGLSLLALFSFTVSSPPNIAMGLGFFVAAVILLIVGYMIGFIVLAFLTFLFLAQI
jgi:hypothetical protein